MSSFQRVVCNALKLHVHVHVCSYIEVLHKRTVYSGPEKTLTCAIWLMYLVMAENVNSRLLLCSSVCSDSPFISLWGTWLHHFKGVHYCTKQGTCMHVHKHIPCTYTECVTSHFFSNTQDVSTATYIMRELGLLEVDIPSLPTTY